MKESKPILELQGVSFCYPQSHTPALCDINLSVAHSEIVVLCGESGCGKSTLLSHMKKNHIPFGSGSGRILFCGQDLEQMADRESVRRIGFVGQNPEEQIVTDKVWHELAFGLENLGVAGREIRRRTAEMAEYFGMSSWFRKSVSELSGGQKQLLNLASVMVMRPELLILDEPASQLDPIGGQRFIQTLQRLNQEMGTTIVLSEQRLEEVLPIAHHVVIMQDGRILADGAKEECGELLRRAGEKAGKPLPIMDGLPAALRVFMQCTKAGEEKAAPLSVREGRLWLQQNVPADITKEVHSAAPADDVLTKRRNIFSAFTKKEKKKDIILQAKNISFGYEKGKYILEDANLSVEKGCRYAILGGNGSGKTTALKVLAGIYKPWGGAVFHQGRVRYLAQNPQTLFTEITAEDELAEGLSGTLEEKRERVESMLAWLSLTGQRKQNPFDLSGGQKQRLALGKVLLSEPDILLLDEPTKGMDASFKNKLAKLLRDLSQQGLTIVLVSHDMEFCAANATHCGLLFDGELIVAEDAGSFFRENVFYTTAAARMAAGIWDDCVLCRDIVERLQKVR